MKCVFITNSLLRVDVISRNTSKFNFICTESFCFNRVAAAHLYGHPWYAPASGAEPMIIFMHEKGV